MDVHSSCPPPLLLFCGLCGPFALLCAVVLVGFLVGFPVGFLVGFPVGFLVGFLVGFPVLTTVSGTVWWGAQNNCCVHIP